MNRKALASVLLVAMALAGQAVAEEIGTDVEYLTATPSDAGGKAWAIDEPDLARLYPAVARAVESPHFLIEVGDDELESTRLFFGEYVRLEADTIEVAGRFYSVGIAMASGVAPIEGERTATSHGEVPADASSHGEVPPDATSHAGADEERRGLEGALLTIAGLGVLVGLGGVGVAALAVRRR